MLRILQPIWVEKARSERNGAGHSISRFTERETRFDRLFVRTLDLLPGGPTLNKRVFQERAYRTYTRNQLLLDRPLGRMKLNARHQFQAVVSDGGEKCGFVV